MATEQQQRKIGLFFLIGLLALAALAFVAANSGIPWLEAWFSGDGGMGGASAAVDGDLPATGADDGSGGEAATGNGCFLGIICLNTFVGLDGTNVNVRADDEGVNASSD